MGTLVRNRNEKAAETKLTDLSLAAVALADRHWSVSLEDTGTGRILFVLGCDPKEFAQLERDFWSGELKIIARDFVSAQRDLKSRLYSLKAGRP